MSEHFNQILTLLPFLHIGFYTADLGFQLSVLATGSLFAFSQPVRAWLERFAPLRWSGARFITSALTATLAVQVLVLPLILYHFGNLSLIAPLANVVLVPVVPFAMILGALALLVNLLAAPLAAVPLLGSLAAPLVQGVWLVAWLPFAAMTTAVQLLAGLPGAAVQVPTLPLWVLLAYYAIVAAWWLPGQRPPAAPAAPAAESQAGG